MTKQQFIDGCRNAASNLRSGDRDLAHLGMLALKDLEFATFGDPASDQECVDAIKDAWQAERDYIVANNATKQESSGPLEKCPKCGGTDFESPDGPLFIADDRIEECIKCNSCGSLWWEYYDHSKTIYETAMPNEDKTHKPKAFQQAYERYMEEEAKREQENRSTGSEEECCRTCNCSVGGPDAMEGHGNYVLCVHWNETRTLDSVCMEWYHVNEKTNQMSTVWQ